MSGPKNYKIFIVSPNYILQYITLYNTEFDPLNYYNIEINSKNLKNILNDLKNIKEARVQSFLNIIYLFAHVLSY